VAVSPDGHVFATDPDGLRVLEFTSTGEFVRGWSEFNPGFEGFNIPSGITVDPSGRVWVTDASTGQIYRFTLP
jgi:streptogramin lyase